MKKYVIIKIGKRFVLKEKYKEDFFGVGLFSSRNLDTVKDFAESNHFEVAAIGDIYEV